MLFAALPVMSQLFGLPMPPGVSAGHGIVGHRWGMGPGDVKIRLTNGRSLAAAPVTADMTDMVVPEVAAAQAWYEKRGGETPRGHSRRKYPVDAGQAARGSHQGTRV